MTSSPPSPTDAYVWTWLPKTTQPVVAGRLVTAGSQLHFIYGRSYRERPGAVPIYLPELPLQAGTIAPPPNMMMASAIRDGAPDAWGRRVILNRKFGAGGKALDGRDLDELIFLLESGSDRTGALDFQRSPVHYEARGGGHATLDELLAAAERVERNLPLTPELDQALQHGSSIGGARPKATITDANRQFVAKFSSGTDTYSVVKGEYIAMTLAARAGLAVAPVQLVQAAGKDVLLVERFDRVPADGGWQRRAMVSALTILELDEMQARYASYQDLAERIRFRFTDPGPTLRELYARMTFNILVGNLDDHARNHAAFWDGARLSLTPAYDICPQARTGEEASQAMLILDQQRSSQVGPCLAAAPHFHLAEQDAIAIVAAQIDIIGQHWAEVCAQAELGPVDRAFFWGRQFLNPYAFYGLTGTAAELAGRADAYRTQGS